MKRMLIIVSLAGFALAALAVDKVDLENRLRLFAANLHKAFYGFEPDFFQQNLVRIVDDVISVVKGSIELWPTLVEIVYFQKVRHGLPQLAIKNRRVNNSAQRGRRRKSAAEAGAPAPA